MIGSAVVEPPTRIEASWACTLAAAAANSTGTKIERRMDFLLECVRTSADYASRA
jgi:hypothetical protein